jgi:hypothetical protein
MALPILDGNQTSTTLATTVSGGAHYPNHILASSVTISSLPPISGAVTIGAGTAQIGSVTASISGTVPISISSVTIGNFPATQPISIASVTIGSALPAGTNRIGVVTIGAGTVTIGAGVAQIGSVTASLSNAVSPQLPTNYSGDPYPVGSKIIPVGGWTDEVDGAHWQALSITDAGSLLTYTQIAPSTNSIGVVTIGGGTVTASLQFTTTAGQTVQDGLTKILQQELCPGLYQNNIQPYGVPIAFIDPSSEGIPTFRVVGNNGNSLPVTITTGYNRIGVVTIGAGTVTIGAGTAQIGSVTASISGTVTVSSTTVTVSALPSGSLTTRFGSVTTANTAQITTSVTNTSRKYLLAQNISTGTVTIGIGFSPTTTQGIQLTAGAGLTFDAFVPTGAVYWLGATTGAAYTILEG